MTIEISGTYNKEGGLGEFNTHRTYCSQREIVSNLQILCQWMRDMVKGQTLF